MRPVCQRRGWVECCQRCRRAASWRIARPSKRTRSLMLRGLRPRLAALALPCRKASGLTSGLRKTPVTSRIVAPLRSAPAARAVLGASRELGDVTTRLGKLAQTSELLAGWQRIAPGPLLWHLCRTSAGFWSVLSSSLAAGEARVVVYADEVLPGAALRPGVGKTTWLSPQQVHVRAAAKDQGMCAACDVDLSPGSDVGMQTACGAGAVYARTRPGVSTGR